MDPSRKRRIRLVVALTAALLLAGALAYTSFSASSPAVQPSRLLASADAGRSYQLTGKVVDGSIEKRGNATLFRVRDRNGRASVPVRYVGAVPDPFRNGREVIVTVRKHGDLFVGEKDSLVTKCPSKFTDEPAQQS
jgi:cytochrome c-type biogenesis protein CcmE